MCFSEYFGGSLTTGVGRGGAESFSLSPSIHPTPTLVDLREFYGTNLSADGVGTRAVTASGGEPSRRVHGVDGFWQGWRVAGFQSIRCDFLPRLLLSGGHGSRVWVTSVPKS